MTAASYRDEESTCSPLSARKFFACQVRSTPTQDELLTALCDVD
jgi:hypothetical protein